MIAIANHNLPRNGRGRSVLYFHTSLPRAGLGNGVGSLMGPAGVLYQQSSKAGAPGRLSQII